MRRKPKPNLGAIWAAIGLNNFSLAISAAALILSNMIFQITLKDPDCFFDIEHLSDADKVKARVAAEKWLEYGEYLTIEVDTKGAAKVLPVKD